jgi:AbiV family abortive infection protein
MALRHPRTVSVRRSSVPGKSAEQSEPISPSAAREFWKALMDNASSLIADAHLLLDAKSYGRTWSLTVLAQEELGKALWLYDEFQAAWSAGDDTPQVVKRLEQHGRRHTVKYLEAVVYGHELASFWGDYESILELKREGESWEEARERRYDEAEVAAREANVSKQRGFYVDRNDAGVVLAPSQIEAGAIAEQLQTAAQVVEMLLIRDHSRMKMEAVTPYDSTHEQQFRLLPVAHPVDWAAASDEFKAGPIKSEPQE